MGNTNAKPIKDLAGKIFGKWSVSTRAPSVGKQDSVYWLCRCSCGVEKPVSGAALRRGRSTSCGHPVWKDVVQPEDLVAGQRVCTKCLTPKEPADFYTRHSWCKKCNKAAKNLAYAEGRTKTSREGRGRKQRNAPVDGWKRCSSCGTFKATEKFKQTSVGGFAHCLDCSNDYGRHRYAEVMADPAKRQEWKLRIREGHLRRAYDMTIDDYEEMKKTQEGCCAICGSESPLVVDHSHQTGKVRALLCNPCNTLLGVARENPEVARRAADYLEEFQEPAYTAKKEQ